MKRIIILLLGFCLLFTACAAPKKTDGQDADTAAAEGTPLPDNTPVPTAEMQGDLEYFILHELGGGTLRGAGFTEVGGMFGGSMFIPPRYEAKTDEYGVVNSMEDLPREYVLYTVTQWPDVMSGVNYITGIRITDPAVHVFGITTEATAEEFMAAARRFGLEDAPTGDMDADVIERIGYARAASPDGTWNASIFNDGETRTIVFYAPTTNEMGVMF